MNLSDNLPLIGCSVCALLLPLALFCGASAQVAVEYGVIGSKSAPASNIGKALEGRFKPLSEQTATSSARQTSKPQTRQWKGEASSPETTAPSKFNKFTIHSSEGDREITFEQPSQEEMKK